MHWNDLTLREQLREIISAHTTWAICHPKESDILDKNDNTTMEQLQKAFLQAVERAKPKYPLEPLHAASFKMGYSEAIDEYEANLRKEIGGGEEKMINQCDHRTIGVESTLFLGKCKVCGKQVIESGPPNEDVHKTLRTKEIGKS